MPAPFLLPAALSLLSVGGNILTNRQNRDIAREQMNFQERMSSTAVQRSVEDYRKAGLNPALAYDRSASSPGGASTTIGDPIASGIGSATAAARARAELKVLAHTANKEESQAQLNVAQRHNIAQKSEFELLQQPHDNRRAKAEADLTEYLRPGAKNTADLETMLGRASPGMATAKTAAEILKMIFNNSNRNRP